MDSLRHCQYYELATLAPFTQALSFATILPLVAERLAEAFTLKVSGFVTVTDLDSRTSFITIS